MHARTIRKAGEITRAAVGVGRLAKPGAVSVRASLTVSGHTQDHQVGIPAMEHAGAKPVSLQHTRSIALDQNLGHLDEYFEHGLRFRMLPVERERALPAAGRLPHDGPRGSAGANVAHDVTLAGALNCDDI